MKKQTLKFKVLIVLCLALALVCQEAYAWGGGRGYHYYRNGRWYQHGWFWLDTAVAALTIGALVENLPPRYTTVVYAGAPYYYADSFYYRPYQYGGYIVVPPPVVAQPVVVQQQVQPIETPAALMAQPQAAQVSDTVTVNIPNSKGGYTAVTLKKAGHGYIGPQGEYYSEHPTVEQLKTLYGGN